VLEEFREAIEEGGGKAGMGEDDEGDGRIEKENRLI
jgi:hypothetical protein